MAIGTGLALAGGALLGSGLLGGGSRQSGTTTTTTSPWEPIQPYLLDVARRGQQLARRAPFDFTNVSPFTQQAEQLTAQRALDPNSLVGRSQGVLGDTISGKYLDPNSNPYFKPYLDQALGQAASTFAGQYGGNAGANISNSGYREQLAKNLGQVATGAYSDLYNNERQNQLNALQLAPSLDYANLGALSQVGAAQDARRQQQYFSPFENLARYQQAISGGLGFGSSSTPNYTNPWANALGGALGVAGLNRLAGGGLFGGGATAAPALLSGLEMTPAAALAGGFIPL